MTNIYSATILPSPDNERSLLPLPPLAAPMHEMVIYTHFMRHLRHVPTSKVELKILSAIQFTADVTGHSDAHVAKTLVDMGLRAARYAFPAEFLKYADQALMREGWEVGAPSAGLWALKDWWSQTGEDKFAAFQGGFDVAVAREIVG